MYSYNVTMDQGLVLKPKNDYVGKLYLCNLSFFEI